MKIKNILSFDIEGLIESSHDSMYIPEKYINQKEENYQITEKIDYLIEHQLKFQS